ncbi:IMPACT family protein [Marinicella rhabdoformis]|uniref:IMPACT family protein n=1 Tax=Marinicella rhabdoformis TaxID=2580566 RepID=UPI0012AEB785|nr:YigZ family protein [Marinicella rhabdoformis]
MSNKRLTRLIEREEEIKKSLFIGLCSPIKSIEDFDAFYAQHAIPDATHNCWAYRMGQTYRFNDDGEPSGTAGKPILAAIDGADFDGVAALVIRHYGGIKLGTGGLARAYGGVIARALQQAPYEIHVPHETLTVQLPFANEQIMHQLLKTADGSCLHVDYISEGILAKVELPSHTIKTFTEQLNNASKGEAQIKPLNDTSNK